MNEELNSNNGESLRIYKDNRQLVSLLRIFIFVDLFMGVFQIVGAILMTVQTADIPSDCSDINKLFIPYLVSFISGFIYISTNLFAVRNWDKAALKYSNLFAFLCTLALKIFFVAYAAAKRNRNMGMCFFYSGQNIFFIVEGSIEILCLLITLYLMFALSEMIQVRRLTGRLDLMKILKKVE
ncbi:hypothetical protein ABPG72_018092 [Tetrahymena utriculariae]